MQNSTFGRSFLIIFITLFFLQGNTAMAESKTTIVEIGDPILREKSRELSMDEIHSPTIQSLIQTMKETVHGLGVGLAAPQIGYSLQIAVIEDLQEYIDRLPVEVREERGRRPIPLHVLINPKIVSLEEEDKALFFEACLSIPNAARVTPRAKRIVVEFLNEHGEKQVIKAEGWYARILQHEIGHLQGTLFIDVADPRTEISMEEYKEKWLYARMAEIKKFYDERVN